MINTIYAQEIMEISDQKSAKSALRAQRIESRIAAKAELTGYQKQLSAYRMQLLREQRKNLQLTQKNKRCLKRIESLKRLVQKKQSVKQQKSDKRIKKYTLKNNELRATLKNLKAVNGRLQTRIKKLRLQTGGQFRKKVQLDFTQYKKQISDGCTDITAQLSVKLNESGLNLERIRKTLDVLNSVFKWEDRKTVRTDGKTDPQTTVSDGSPAK
jgi:hypothetical protein